jgi:hypothetical protein
MSASDVIARLRELRAKATAGPWVTVGWNEATSIEGADVFVRGRLGFLDGGKHKQDAAAIVAAMNSLESLLDAAEQGDNLIRAINRYVATRAVYLMNLEEDQTQIDARDKLGTALEKARAALQALAEGGGE